MYIGKEITKLVSFTELKGEYYIHLEFIGTFKIGKAIEYNQEYIRAIKDTNRTTTYKFSKYGR